MFTTVMIPAAWTLASQGHDSLNRVSEVLPISVQTAVQVSVPNQLFSDNGKVMFY